MARLGGQLRLPPGWERNYPELQRLDSTAEREAAWTFALGDQRFVEHVAFLLTSVVAFPFFAIVVVAAVQGRGILPAFSLYWLVLAAVVILLLIGLCWGWDQDRRRRLVEYSIVLIAELLMGCDFVARIQGGANRWTLWVAIPLYALIPMVVLFVSRRREIRRSLWVYLNTHDEATCVTCGYNLTGNVSGVCPECGTSISEKG
jgi:hypothetical protein